MADSWVHYEHGVLERDEDIMLAYFGLWDTYLEVVILEIINYENTAELHNRTLDFGLIPTWSVAH